MNCRQAEHQIFSDHDTPSSAEQQAAVAAHLAQCPACQRMSDAYLGGIGRWRAEVAAVPTPDPMREWQALRAAFRSEPEVARRSIGSWLAWVGAPLTAAAAVALAFVMNPDWRQFDTDATPAPRALARAEYVSVPSANVSTVVFVDEKSGWLVVLASDNPRRL